MTTCIQQISDRILAVGCNGGRCWFLDLKNKGAFKNIMKLDTGIFSPGSIRRGDVHHIRELDDEFVVFEMKNGVTLYRKVKDGGKTSFTKVEQEYESGIRSIISVAEKFFVGYDNHVIVLDSRNELLEHLKKKKSVIAVHTSPSKSSKSFFLAIGAIAVLFAIALGWKKGWLARS